VLSLWAIRSFPMGLVSPCIAPMRYGGDGTQLVP
jgi:hypothetical protein